MGKIKEPKRVKPFVGLLLSNLSLVDNYKKSLKYIFGESDLQSKMIPFSHTTYYNKEMGDTIFRLWISFSNLKNPDQLPLWKVKTNELEENFSRENMNKMYRRVNIDPGYITDSKVLLASTKNFYHRIYLNSGIFAEITLSYSKEVGWQPNPWTYPDYQDIEATDFFIKARNIYRLQYKKLPTF